MNANGNEYQITVCRHRDLEIYKIAFDCAVQIWELSKKFPVEERYSR